MSNSTSSEEEEESLLRVKMTKGNHRNQQQRRAAWSAAAILSCVGLLFILGFYLFFRSMYIYNSQKPRTLQQSVVRDVEVESARDVATMSQSHEKIMHEMLRRKTEEESSSSSIQQRTANGHFNVSFLVDNTPSGGTKGLVIITVMPELAPLGARR